MITGCNMQCGKVIKTLNSFYYVEQNGEIISCKLRGRFKKERINIFVGDVVEFEKLSENTGIIEKLLPRKNLLLRPLISNIDQAVVVFAAAYPNPNYFLIDKILVSTEHSNIPEIILCINKTDLIDITQVENFFSKYKKIGYKLVTTSTFTGKGINELKECLKGKTTVFAGPSGVGKSSLLNLLNPSLELDTGELSEKIKRGKHTTRLSRLFSLCGGKVADTPGFSSVDLSKLSKEELSSCFVEFLPFLSECHYRACTHSHEPGCSLKTAVDNGLIDLSRYHSYLKILQEINERKISQK